MHEALEIIYKFARSALLLKTNNISMLKKHLKIFPEEACMCASTIFDHVKKVLTRSKIV